MCLGPGWGLGRKRLDEERGGGGGGCSWGGVMLCTRRRRVVASRRVNFIGFERLERVACSGLRRNERRG